MPKHYKPLRTSMIHGVLHDRNRFQRKYGFWRPVVRRAVNNFLNCGDPREGETPVEPGCLALAARVST